MRGSAQDSVSYCSKEDTHFFEWGVRPQNGGKGSNAARPIHAAIADIEGGKTLEEMARSGSHGEAIVKFDRGLTKYRSLRAAPRDPSVPPVVMWIYGPTGTGKSLFAFDFLRNCFGLGGVWLCNTSNLQWFDGYSGQPGAVFDDFRSKGVPFNYVLRVADRYPLQVPVKGGFVNWAPKIIIFTTTGSLEDTFKERNKYRPEDLRQLERRLTGGVWKLPEQSDALSNLLRRSLSPTETADQLLETLKVEQGELSAKPLEPKLSQVDLGEVWDGEWDESQGGTSEGGDGRAGSA